MNKDNKKQVGVLGLIVALVVALIGGVLFVGAASGWFDDPKVELDTEYYSEGAEFMELTAGEYEGLVGAKKSFVVMVDQNGCTTADRLREYVAQYMTETGILAYRMMFSELKESSLHKFVKYYPSMVIIDKGVVRGYLSADSNEDAEAYNDYDMFKEWMGKYLQ